MEEKEEQQESELNYKLALLKLGHDILQQLENIDNRLYDIDQQIEGFFRD